MNIILAVGLTVFPSIDLAIYIKVFSAVYYDKGSAERNGNMLQLHNCPHWNYSYDFQNSNLIYGHWDSWSRERFESANLDPQDYKY